MKTVFCLSAICLVLFLVNWNSAQLFQVCTRSRECGPNECCKLTEGSEGQYTCEPEGDLNANCKVNQQISTTYGICPCKYSLECKSDGNSPSGYGTCQYSPDLY